MNDKELWELMSIICEGQDSEQRRKVEQYITDLQKEIERLNNIINELETYIIENSFGSPLHNCSVIESYKVLDKLQELKGSVSNE